MRTYSLIESLHPKESNSIVSLMLLDTIVFRRWCARESCTIVHVLSKRGGNANHQTEFFQVPEAESAANCPFIMLLGKLEHLRERFGDLGLEFWPCRHMYSQNLHFLTKYTCASWHSTSSFDFHYVHWCTNPFSLPKTRRLRSKPRPTRQGHRVTTLYRYICTTWSH